MLVRELNKKITNTMPEPERLELIKKMRKSDEKMVNGVFEFIDAQGGWLEFAYRKFPGEPILMLKIMHGENCDLPMGLVKHLNNTKKKVRRYNLELHSSAGKPPRSFETISRVRFVPSDML